MFSVSELQKVVLRKTATDQVSMIDEKKEHLAKSSSVATLADAVAKERAWNARLRAVDLESWYESIKENTFATTFVDLTMDEARAMMDAYWKRKKSGSTTEYDSFVSQSDTLQRMKEKIQSVMQEFGANCAVFAKLSSRSPKDSTMCEQRALQQATKELLSIQQAQLGSSSSPSSKLIAFNTIQTVIMRAGIQALSLKSADEVIECFCSSDRVCEDDLPLALGFADKWSQHIVLRQWITIPTHGEFRVFVMDGRITAISQYFVGVHFPELSSQKELFQQLIFDLFDRVKDRIPVHPAEYVLDVAVDIAKHQAYVIELNPFGRPDAMGSGCCLFRIGDQSDRAVLFGDAPFEMRIEQCVPDVDPKKLLREGPLKDFLIEHGMIAL